MLIILIGGFREWGGVGGRCIMAIELKYGLKNTLS